MVGWHGTSYRMSKIRIHWTMLIFPRYTTLLYLFWTIETHIKWTDIKLHLSFFSLSFLYTIEFSAQNGRESRALNTQTLEHLFDENIFRNNWHAPQKLTIYSRLLFHLATIKAQIVIIICHSNAYGFCLFCEHAIQLMILRYQIPGFYWCRMPKSILRTMFVDQNTILSVSL